MRIHEFTSEQWLPVARAELFPFFADAANLQEITPPWLDFRVATPQPLAMRVGALIDSRLKVRGIPLRWRSEITAWEPPRRFIDEQRRGPYRLWIHEHLFEQREGGTMITDRVRYAVPGGALINWLFVRRDLVRIFAHRTTALGRRFGDRPSSRAPLAS
jgi:ligand-binding SRPBCC domain-containing protein